MSSKISIHRNNVIIYYKKQGSECRYNTGLKVNSVKRNNKFIDWDYKRERFKSHVNNAELNNKLLDKWQAQADAIITDMLTNGLVPLGSVVKSKLENIKIETADKASMTFLDYFETFIAIKKNFLYNSPKKSKSSFQDYKTLHNTLLDYRDTIGEFTLSDINHNWLQDFKIWLSKTNSIEMNKPKPRTKGGLGAKSIRKRFDVIKTFFIWLEVEKVHYEVQMIKTFCGKLESEDTIFDTLTIEEVKAFYQTDLGSERLNKIRDMFVFACHSSFRWTDLVQTSSIFVKENKIIKTAYKTRNTSRAKHIVPLSSTAKEILERYNYSFPKISHVNANKYIKEALKKTGLFERPANRTHPDGTPKKLHESISFHDGRRSFISNMVNHSDLPWTKIMAIAAHTKVDSLFKYVDKSRDIDDDATSILE